MVLYLLAVVWGVQSLYQGQAQALDVLLGLLPAAVAALWCVLDARAQARPAALSLQGLTSLTRPVAVPAYLCWSRAGPDLAVAALHAVGPVRASRGALHAAGELLYGPARLRGLGLSP